MYLLFIIINQFYLFIINDILLMIKLGFGYFVFYFVDIIFGIFNYNFIVIVKVNFKVIVIEKLNKYVKSLKFVEYLEISYINV